MSYPELEPTLGLLSSLVCLNANAHQCHLDLIPHVGIYDAMLPPGLARWFSLGTLVLCPQ